MKKVLKASLIMAGLLGTVATYAVTPVENTSPYGFPVAVDNDKPHEIKYIVTGFSDDNLAALNVVDEAHTTGYANNKLVSFTKMKKMTSNIFVPKDFVSPDTNDVYVARLYRMTGFPWSSIPGMPDHSHLGRLTFNQVSDTMDVWYGDWTDVPSGAASGTAGTNYTVFYSGSNPTTSLPTSGVATYTVKGINNYVNKNTPLLSGTLTADFGTCHLDGTISRSDLSIAISANINNAQAYFNGTAVANSAITGKTGGYFYGDQGAALAGVATFGEHSPLNTSFGGTKQ